jgi:peptidoglycan/LPS O-acetylase OafA/YrhL
MADVSPMTEEARRHIRTLDGWRALAILLVLLDHGADPLLRFVLGLMGHTGAFVSEHYTFIKNPVGRGGVHLFFALSGYLITRRLIEEELRHGRINLQAFYIRRLFRIQPAAIFYLLVVGVLGLSAVLAVSARGWLCGLFACANLTLPWQTWYTEHFWSLAVEEQFYLLWPVAFVLMGTRRRLAGALAIVLLLGAWLAIVVRYHVTASPNMWVRPDIEGPWLMWGCVAALAEHSRYGRRLLELLSRPGICLIAVPLALLSLTYDVFDWKIFMSATFLCAAATPLLLLGTVRRPDGLLGRILELAAVAWLGRISYSLYLWQQLFLVWDDARAPRLGFLQSPPWAIIAAFACATTSYYWLEKPMINLGRAVLRRRVTSAPAHLLHRNVGLLYSEGADANSGESSKH